MSGTWAVLWPSGKPYGDFHRSYAEAALAAAHASRVQNQPMRVVLWC